MRKMVEEIYKLFVRYPYVLYIMLFLCVSWLIYRIFFVVKQMDFGHSITDVYDKNGRKRKPKVIKAKFTGPIISVVICVVLILVILK